METAYRKTTTLCIHYCTCKNRDLLEIYHSGILKQKYYKKKANAPYIVGIAAGYSGAVDLVIDMVEDVYQEMEHTT